MKATKAPRRTPHQAKPETKRHANGARESATKAGPAGQDANRGKNAAQGREPWRSVTKDTEATYSAGDFQRDFGAVSSSHEFTGLRMCAANLPVKSDLDKGWWFLSHSELVKSWPDLGAALAVLKQHGIDPQGDIVAKFGRDYSEYESWGTERAPYDKLRTALEGCTGLPKTSDAEALRKEWLGVLIPRLDRASKSKPRRSGKGGGIENRALREVSALAACSGWPPEALAAALLLTGAQKVSWDSLRRKVAGRWREWKIEPLAKQIRARHPLGISGTRNA